MAKKKNFPSPFEVETIPGTEGWEKMYPYFYHFSEDRREWEEKQFWFFDGLHLPDPVPPFSLITGTSWQLSLSATICRLFAIPVADGIPVRILNGYWYQSPQAVTDPKEIEERVPLFEKRTGYYYGNWNELYEDWVKKVEATIEDLKKIEFKDLPRFEKESLVLENTGITSGYRLIESYEKLVMNMHLIWQYHHEFLGLTYMAYLMFYDYCEKAFPGISPNSIAKMVAGAESMMMFRPEEELAKLGKLAVSLNVVDVFKGKLSSEETISELEKTDQGKRWLDGLEQAKDPWFYVSSGTGYYYYEPSWIDDLTIPFKHINNYIERLEAGETIDRPVEKLVEEKERLIKEYRGILPTDEDKKAFDKTYGLLQLTYPYTENHIFYVEHWHHTIFWQKVRDLGKVMTNAGFFKEPEDIFNFYYTDITPMLLDLTYNWGSGPNVPARGPVYWAKEVDWRKSVMKKLREWTPLPALGPAPEKVTDPFAIQLWGITTEMLDSWLSAKEPVADEVAELKGFPASAGVAEGTARVIRTAGDLDQLEAGEILVCPITSPSWAPAFSRMKGAVTDQGGMSCHAAIVAREYGLPCVVGTGYGTKLIKTGDKVKLDGTTGVVTIER